MSTEVYVYADWEDFEKPALVGMLRSDLIKKKEHFSFSYDHTWLRSGLAQKIDPDLELYTGDQYSQTSKNFRVFLDSCPDRWGRLLMKRREAIRARQEGRPQKVLNEIDYLLGVHDIYRSGALRFKKDPDGEFLDNDKKMAAPPFSSLRELEYAAQNVEDDTKLEDEHEVKWLAMLISPGSALGGARPKANVVAEDGHFWIAKFPSRHDDYDIAAWEYVVYLLALKAGIDMAESHIEKFNSHHHTFLTKRFDRSENSRLHFTSAMTQLGYYDGDYEASYLELAEFLTNHGANTKADLAQLWRRIIFNIAVSNNDDHLRNHGFIYREGGWVLSPAFDINPVTPSNGLHLNISDDDNSLDYDLAMEVIGFFQLGIEEAQTIKNDVLSSVEKWQVVAAEVGISRAEQQKLKPAFKLA